MNSFHAIEDAGQAVQPPRIEIVVKREAVLPGLDVLGRVDGFTVTDNGIGFDEPNLDAFFTSDTQNKVGRGGKGIGRFVWLKAFDRAEIDSHYHQNGRLVERTFAFTIDGDQPAGPPVASAAGQPKTTVRLVAMKAPYKDHCPHRLPQIGHQLVEHCLPFFMDPKCPAVRIQDDLEGIDLNTYFRQTFAARATRHDFTIKEKSFTLKGLRLKNPHETDHRLLYAANFREVIDDKLERYIPNLQRRLIDENGVRFVYLGFVESEYLDQNVNNERTGFTFPAARDSGALLDDISLDMIREGALAGVRLDLKPFLDDINTEKRAAINSYITHEAPQYRPLVRYIDEFIDRIPPGAAGRTLEAALHEQMYEKTTELRRESHSLFEDAGKQALKPEEYEAKLGDFLERANELGKSSLAQYVAHRKVILEFLEKSLQASPDTGKYSIESTIHRIIYPMRTTSDEVPYEQQNLWIIDERLAYHAFLGSDMALDNVSMLVNESEARPDLLIFQRALSFGEDEGALNSVVIVEFKKPDRSDYSKEDPVDQVYRLIRDIKNGHFKDKHGREVKVQSASIPAYAYVICDTTKEVEIIAQNKGMWPTPDNLGYYFFNQPLATYVEIISYTKLLQDAKKRNRILFDKLNLPVHNS